MASWQFFVYPATDLTQPMAELADVRGRRVTWRLADAADAEFTIDGHHELATLIDELVVDLVVTRDRVPLFRGRIGATDDDCDTDQHVTTYAAVDYTALLDRRLLTTPQAPWTFTAIAQGSIVRQLIDWTQGTTGGDLNITDTTATVPNTATTRTIIFEPAKSIGEAIDDLAGLENGFDWWIGPDLVAWLASPTRGRVPDLVAEYGSTVTKVHRMFDPAAYANAIMVTGQNGTVPQYATAGDLATRPEGRVDGLESFPDIASTTVLQARANEALALRSSMRPAYTCTLTPGVWTPNALWLGDLTQLRIRSGRLDVNVNERVTELAATIDDEGNETIDVTFGAVPPSMATRIRRTDHRLARLERLGA